MGRIKPRADIDVRARVTYDGIVWHHSTAKDGLTYDWDALKAYHTSHKVGGKAVGEPDYRKAFIQQRGALLEEPMRCVGFHFGVEYAEGEGGVFSPVIHLGRSLDIHGQHAAYKGNPVFDNRYIGLVAIGNFDVKAVRPEMWDACLRLTRALMDPFGFAAGKVIGHREADILNGAAAPRSCPGELWSMDKFRKDL